MIGLPVFAGAYSSGRRREIIENRAHDAFAEVFDV